MVSRLVKPPQPHSIVEAVFNVADILQQAADAARKFAESLELGDIDAAEKAGNEYNIRIERVKELT